MRAILHLDMDAFFAAVEQLDNPQLKGKPVIVGGVGKRGVVATCSYEARRFGVRSAMPWFRAVKLCPDGIFLSGRFHRYRELSRQVFEILQRYSPFVEPISIDEAFLDITDVESDPAEMAMMLKRVIHEETGLTVSVGLSYNKFLAKLASEWKKPDGFFEIRQEDIPEILKPMAVSKVYGLGARSVAKLNQIGIFTVGDLLKYDRDFMMKFMGSHGSDIYDLIRGCDERPVRMDHSVKSIGRETTLMVDCTDHKALLEILQPFCRELELRMIRRGLKAFTITLKYKTVSFRQFTRSRTVSIAMGTAEDMNGILQEIMEQQTFHEPIRLIGVTVSNFEPVEMEQMCFPV